ncbi:MAG: alkaline phosphatase family protein [Anaerolineae bacterium]
MRLRNPSIYVIGLTLVVLLQACSRGTPDNQQSAAEPPTLVAQPISTSPSNASSGLASPTATVYLPTVKQTAPPAAPATAPTTTPTPPTGTPHISTVFVIVMENHNWSAIKGSRNAPYINDTLLPMASHAEQYYNPPDIHPSLPNYLWLEAGTNFGILDDGDPGEHHQSTTNHLVTLLNQAGISWKAYEENISGAACPLTSADSFAVRHDPMLYFDDVTDNNNPHSQYCISHVRPYAELSADLQNDRTAQYNFITPNLCDDMHNICAPTFNSVRQGDNWLASEVPKILASPAYKRGGALIITWDEGEGSDGPIGLIVLSPYAKGKGYRSVTHYTHSSTLRTIQEIFDVRPFLGDAANAVDLSDLFTIPLRQNESP